VAVPLLFVDEQPRAFVVGTHYLVHVDLFDTFNKAVNAARTPFAGSAFAAAAFWPKAEDDRTRIVVSNNILFIFNMS